MWKDSIRNIVAIFHTTILKIVGFYVRHLAQVFIVLGIYNFGSDRQNCAHLKRSNQVFIVLEIYNFDSDRQNCAHLKRSEALIASVHH